MNVVARHMLSTDSHILSDQGFRPRQSYDLLWCDVRSTSRRI